MIISFYPGAGGNKFFRSISGLEWQVHGIAYDNLVRDQESQHRYLYENSAEEVSDEDIVLTHCVHTPLVRRLFPSHAITVIAFPFQDCLRREWQLAGRQRYIDRTNHGKQQNFILNLYRSIKDRAWPEITCADEIDRLPQDIKDELSMELTKNQSVNKENTTAYAKLKKKYQDDIESAYEAIIWHENYYNQYPLDISFASKVIYLSNHSEFATHMRSELDLYPSATFDDCWRILHE